jgi:hypothetical protein
MEAIMSIIAVVIALLFAASSAYVIVSGIRGDVVAPASVTQRRPVIYRTQSVLSETTARTADREQLRRYFLQGRADGRGPVFPWPPQG